MTDRDVCALACAIGVALFVFGAVAVCFFAAKVARWEARMDREEEEDRWEEIRRRVPLKVAAVVVMKKREGIGFALPFANPHPPAVYEPPRDPKEPSGVERIRA